MSADAKTRPTARSVAERVWNDLRRGENVVDVFAAAIEADRVAYENDGRRVHRTCDANALKMGRLLAAARAQRDRAVGLLLRLQGMNASLMDDWNGDYKDWLASLAPGTEPTETTKETT